MSQLACEENEGKISGALVMSGMIGSPYEKTRFGTPTPLATAEQIGKDFFEFLGVKTLEEARALDAFEIRDKYSDFAKDHPRMYTVIDGVFCKEDPYKKMLEGRGLLVPLMAGNTSDEFLNHIEAKDGEQLLKKAEELFKDKADQFLSFEENKKQTPEGFSPVSGIEYSVKRAFLSRKATGCNQNSYYYRFDADIPGWDNAGTFHSCDLWFFFETLAKCWRPFDGHHYDLARQISSYFVNFIKTGNPNGNDYNENKLPEWKPYCDADRYEMNFTKDGAAGGSTETERMRFLLDNAE